MMKKIKRMFIIVVNYKMIMRKTHIMMIFKILLKIINNNHPMPFLIECKESQMKHINKEMRNIYKYKNNSSEINKMNKKEKLKKNLQKKT